MLPGVPQEVRGAAILPGSHKVFADETVVNEVYALTAPRGNQQPNRRVKFSDSGMYKGTTL